MKLPIKDQHLQPLHHLVTEVNSVWNYVNDWYFTHLKRTGHFFSFSAYDVAQYTADVSKELNLHSQTIQVATKELVTRRQQFKDVNEVF